jgi:hypothetical protein
MVARLPDGFPGLARARDRPHDQRRSTMHALKIILLLALTIALMRGVSWLLGWALARWWGGSAGITSVTANALGLLSFLAFLHWDRLPGEFFDKAAAVFGAGIYALFAVLDCLWSPWRRKPRPGGGAGK